jgi:2-methylcitrate dehydratase PrpD
VGFSGRSTAALAALVNGTLAHAMDFDDTDNASVMHPSAVSVAAALAMAEATGADGATFLLGVALGNEIGCRLGLVSPGAFHDVGMHPTSVLGTPAAALVAGRLLRLKAGQLESALGISASQGSGVLEAYSDGTWSKTLHPGWAAHGGIVAATLAGSGFSGPASGLDGRYGLFASHIQARGYAFDYAIAAEGLGTRWHGLETAFKLYPCAHSIHVFAETALALRAAHGLSGDDIASVRLDVPAAFVGQIVEPRAAKLAPRTTTHARASALYAVAAALIDGALGMEHYTDGAIARADVLAMCQRITHKVTKPKGPIRFSGAMEIICTDGRVLRMALDEADGTGSRRLGTDRVEAKFRVTAGLRLPRARVERIVELCRGLETAADVVALSQAIGRR